MGCQQHHCYIPDILRRHDTTIEHADKSRACKFFIQRIKLAKELAKGKAAKDYLYILDEPTTGLSMHDSERLLALLDELVDQGNTVVITEHDVNMLSNCDWIIEMGPGGGRDGGYVIAEGTPLNLKTNDRSIIGRYLK